MEFGYDTEQRRSLGLWRRSWAPFRALRRISSTPSAIQRTELVVGQGARSWEAAWGRDSVGMLRMLAHR
jgi:hypothetical protein